MYYCEVFSADQTKPKHVKGKILVGRSTVSFLQHICMYFSFEKFQFNKIQILSLQSFYRQSASIKIRLNWRYLMVVIWKVKKSDALILKLIVWWYIFIIFLPSVFCYYNMVWKRDRWLSVVSFYTKNGKNSPFLIVF